MAHALVVKRLTDQIVLVRMDSGEITSMSVPCRHLDPGSLLNIDLNGSGCPIQAVDGKCCRTACHRRDHAYFIESRDSFPPGIPVPEAEADRHVV